ncbi:PTS sugar transporter subunit IIA [Bacillus cytotoxicus]|uniref:PTS sugar transporter subunit IIA n=1 Tax=Bacillus cytotoxicus TaxID=580165 RepID=A0ACC6AA72_9BACI|nr:PTS sugar transporter subunit IIA [Bacillus cytotoxicus]
MIGILVTTHGEFCNGLLHAAHMIAGEQEGVDAVSLDENGMDDFASRLETKLDEMVEKYNQVLVMCDLKGGTPCNQSLRYGFINEGKIKIVAGVNLPMLIETIFGRSSVESLDELAIVASDSGKQSIEYITL